MLVGKAEELVWVLNIHAFLSWPKLVSMHGAKTRVSIPEV
jgi:hypothetical protein